MTEPTKYYGTYTDDFGTTEIVICNDFKNLSLRIDDVEFKGYEFTDLEIVDKKAYSPKQLERFTLYSTNIYGTNDFVEQICNCTFEITIPQLLIDLQTQEHILVDMKLQYIVGKSVPKPSMGLELENVKLTIIIDGNLYVGTSDLIELTFNQIRSQFSDKYQFKNCYGCMYGDYSVYGQSGFGSMLCFVSQKEKYKEVANKNEYMELTTEESVQEIYCCDKYEVRETGAGYRG